MTIGTKKFVIYWRRQFQSIIAAVFLLLYPFDLMDGSPVPVAGVGTRAIVPLILVVCRLNA